MLSGEEPEYEAILQQLYCYSYHSWSAGNILTLDDHALLLQELDHALKQYQLVSVCEKWYSLGVQLKVSTEMLDRIRAQIPDSRGCLPEMLKAWLSISDNPSWKALTDALNSAIVGDYGLAEYLESKYCPLKDVEESKH